VFNGHTHEQFTNMFHRIGEDPDNSVVILTGRGDAFLDSISPEGFGFFTPRGCDKIFREGREILMNILDIEVPMPARYIVGQDGLVLYSEVNPDYPRRPDPSDMFPVLEKTAARA
jgi:hypothetical protein